MHVPALLPTLVPLVALAEPQMLPRDWHESIPLRQVTVVASAERVAPLAEALGALGADVQTLAPQQALAEDGLHWKPEVTARTVVLVGGIHTNPAMLPLYASYLSFGDAYYPGEDGFVVRTISRPFGPGTAAIALEASSPVGESAAVERFVTLLASVTDRGFPATLEPHLSSVLLNTARSAPDMGMRYVLTGAPESGPEGVRRLLAAADPDRGFAAYGDYGIERYIWEYNHLQDAPGVAPEDVLRLDQALLNTALATEKEWWRRSDGSMIGGRHQTMGTSAFTAAVYLLGRRGNPNQEARTLLDRWWSECQAYWRNACSTFHDDLEGIPVYYCPEPTLDWALIMGFDGYVRQQLPLVIRRAYAVVDNLGYYAGTGTYEECRPGDLFKPVPWGWLLRAAEYFHPGQGYGWLQIHIPNSWVSTWAIARSFAGVRAFTTGTPSTPPGQLLGATVVPLGPYRYRGLSRDPEQARATGQRYIPAPEARCFEKLCFRDSFDLTGQYLCLEGYQAPAADNQPPMDANSIIRYTDLGHIWLHANSEKSGNLFRSAVFCSDGVNDSPQPAGCDLQALHSGSTVSLAASHLPDYVGCDWTRNIICVRGAYFVVIDLLQQNREGKFGLICTFRTPQSAWLTANGMVAREGYARMHLENADPVRLTLEGGHELEGAAVPTLLRQTQLLDGGPGTLRTFRNLVYCVDPDHPGELHVRPLGTQAVMVQGAIRGREELALIAAAPHGQGLKLGRIETDGQLLYAGSRGWAQAGGTYLKLDGHTLEASPSAPPTVPDAAPAPGTEGAPTPELDAALQELLQQSTTVTRPREDMAVDGAARRLWRCEAFSPLSAPIPAPALTSDPPPQGMVGSLFDRVVTRGPTVTWPGGNPVALTLDLHEPRTIGRVDFQVGLFGAYNTIPDPATYPTPHVVQAELSNDAFGADIRRRKLTFTSDCTFEGLHKGMVWPILRWSSNHIGEEGRWLRLTFAAPEWQNLAMNELTVRPTGPSAVRIIGALLRDVNGDAKLETLAWSDQSELAAVRADGSLVFRRRFNGYITSAECYGDLDPTGPRILVTTREARLYCLRPDGSEVWRTDFLESATQNSDLPCGYSIGLLRRPDGGPVIVVGNYNLASFVSPEGQVLQYVRLPAAYQTMTLSRGADYDEDGLEDIVSTEVWGCLSVLDAQMRRRAGGSLPRGKGIKLDYWEPPTPGQARAMVCTENGCGLLDLRTLRYEWLHTARPINDCVIADVEGDGKQEVVLAKHDGYVLIYDEAGALLQAALVGEPVRALAMVPLPGGRPLIVAALPDRLIGLALPSAEPIPLAAGAYGRLLAPGDPGVLLACAEGGTVEALDLSAVVTE